MVASAVTPAAFVLLGVLLYAIRSGSAVVVEFARALMWIGLFFLCAMLAHMRVSL